MIWTIIAAFITLIAGLGLGIKKLFYLDQIAPRRFLSIAAAILLVFFILRILHDHGFFPEAVAGGFMASLYAFVAGFLFGTARWQYRDKNKLGIIEYINRSFASDILPNLIALTLIIAGIARSSVLGAQAITPIRVSSGLSLIAFGVLGLTVRLIPEFRKKGFILLDRSVLWEDFIAYQWVGENVLELEFEFGAELKIYRTVIPVEDRKKTELLLNKKLLLKLEKENKKE